MTHDICRKPGMLSSLGATKGFPKTCPPALLCGGFNTTCWWKESCYPVEAGSLSHDLQGFVHPRRLFGISSINSIKQVGITSFLVKPAKTQLFGQSLWIISGKNMTPKIQLKLFGFFPGFFQRAELSPLLWQQRPQQTAERPGGKPTQEKGVGKVANSTPPKINIIHLKMMVSKRNLLIHGIIFRWTMLNFGSVLKTSGTLRFFLVKHQSSFQLFWVIQNVSDNKFDDTQKAPISLRNRKPLKPLGLSSWLSKKSHNSPWYSDTPFQQNLYILQRPQPKQSWVHMIFHQKSMAIQQTWTYIL